jgi:hypothetical protein
MTSENLPLSENLLTGASAISDHLGKDWPVRRVYYAAERGYLPVKRVGNTMTALKTELDRYFSAMQ